MDEKSESADNAASEKKTGTPSKPSAMNAISGKKRERADDDSSIDSSSEEEEENTNKRVKTK